MTNVFENRLSMYQKVNGYLALHASETSSIAAIATLKTQLDTNINTILSLAAIADADVTGTTVDKQNKRNAAKTALLKVSTACVAHASMNNLIKLKFSGQRADLYATNNQRKSLPLQEALLLSAQSELSSVEAIRV